MFGQTRSNRLHSESPTIWELASTQSRERLQRKKGSSCCRSRITIPRRRLLASKLGCSILASTTGWFEMPGAKIKELCPPNTLPREFLPRRRPPHPVGILFGRCHRRHHYHHGAGVQIATGTRPQGIHYRRRPDSRCLPSILYLHGNLLD